MTKGHIKGANSVDYADMFSKPMMEELNKSNSLVIIHDDQTVAGVIAATLKLMDYPDVYILLVSRKFFIRKYSLISMGSLFMAF